MSPCPHLQEEHKVVGSEGREVSKQTGQYLQGWCEKKGEPTPPAVCPEDYPAIGCGIMGSGCHLLRGDTCLLRQRNLVLSSWQSQDLALKASVLASSQGKPEWGQWALWALPPPATPLWPT